MAKRAAVYARVSTDEQRGNYSIPSQIGECLTYIKNKGYALVGNRFVDQMTGQDAPEGIAAFVDDFSSRETNRPGLDAAYEYLDDYGFDVLVVLSIDRLDRDPYKLHAHEYGFVKGGAVVEYVKGDYTETPEGKFLKSVVASAAKLDNDWRTERFNRGKRQKARRGLFVAGRTPFGYHIDKTAPGGLVIDQDEAEIVTLIYDLYVSQRLSIREIVNRLNELEITPQRGGETWQKSSVSHILENTAYIGQIYYNKGKRDETGTLRGFHDREEWIPIAIPAIIDPVIFSEAQQRRDHNREVVRQQPKRFYLLGGMVFCENCRRVYVSAAELAGEKHSHETRWYRHRMKEGHCTNKLISAPKLEDLVWDSVIGFLQDPEGMEEGYQKAREKEIASNQRQFELRETIYREIGKIQQKQENLRGAYIDPEIGMTKAEYLTQKARIDKEMTTAAAQLTDIDTRLSNLPTPEEYKNLAKFAQELRERLTSPEWNPTPENKKWVLETLRAEVWLDLEGNGRVIGWLGQDIGQMFNTSKHYGHPPRRLPGRASRVPGL